ncbi:class I SAM-dependent methyltransferase [Nioella ostreopsis]|uniref:class I SAM-dependent methyltransferase n=1 Tax=Nioella ostreopsis TaxID=2448479 RepID=UPI001F0C1573|nr:class I SAM-dependent methyltransferase [Nioella ostreopsis]
MGGRWDETGRAQMAVLLEAGLKPHHFLLDIGAGSLRLGCKALDYLDPGHYWATDASREIMLAGRAVELADPSRLPLDHLILDRDFTFPGVPPVITHAIAFAVFPHLRIARLRAALTNMRAFPLLEKLLFTVFLTPDLTLAALPFRQRDGVVTHDQKAPYHLLAEDIEQIAVDTGWSAHRSGTMLPRGQVLFTATPAN